MSYHTKIIRQGGIAMRFLYFILPFSFLFAFFISCSEETITGDTIISTDTIKTGHDERLVGLWTPVKFIKGGETTTIAGGANSSLQIKNDGGYSDSYVETQGNGVWETKGDSLKLKATQIIFGVFNEGNSRLGTYTVSTGEFIFTTGGKTWYYQKN
jgi:hypothetical protein